jgi:hypothetical protein
MALLCIEACSGAGSISIVDLNDKEFVGQIYGYCLIVFALGTKIGTAGI